MLGVKHYRWLPWALVAAVLAAGALLVVYRRNRPPRQRLDETQIAYRGTPTQLRRLRETIETVRSESEEGLVKGLYNDDNYAPFFEFTAARPPQVNLQECLSNRRVLRLQQSVLPEMGETERARFLGQFAERTFRTQCDTMERSLRSHVDLKAPKNTQSIHANTLAICASWWLAAHFASAADVVRHMQELEAYAADLGARVANEPRLPDTEKAMWKGSLLRMQPDYAGKVSILAVAIERDSRVSRAARAEARRLLSSLASSKFVVPRWDAMAKPREAQAFSQGIHYDPSETFAEYTIYRLETGDVLRAQERGQEPELLTALKRLAAGR